MLPAKLQAGELLSLERKPKSTFSVRHALAQTTLKSWPQDAGIRLTLHGDPIPTLTLPLKGRELSVSQSQLARRLAVDGALAQPLERGVVEIAAVHFPHGV